MAKKANRVLSFDDRKQIASFFILLNEVQKRMKSKKDKSKKQKTKLKIDYCPQNRGQFLFICMNFLEFTYN